MYGLGDFTVNTVLSSMSIVYVGYFLTQIAGLRPEYAAAVQLIARSVDAFTDPLMGRVSDLCTWKAGRRRPFFLIGAIPLGIAFGLLWAPSPYADQWSMFLWYTAVYTVMSVALTSVSVPYLALQPEMALGYDARTSLNVYRNAGSIFGVFAAISIRPVADLFGGGPEGFMTTGIVFGFVVAVPWYAVYLATWERPDFQTRDSAMSFADGAKLLLAHPAFRRLTAMYLSGRVAMDLIGAMLILYFTHWIGRSEDFEVMMLIFFLSVLAWLPLWMRIAQRTEKATAFIIGTSIWTVGQVCFLLVDPSWPRWILLVLAPVIAFGYAVVDLMPWSMLGEVVDEDDLAHGERREGVYNGFFMFMRKLAGTIAVALALGLLGWLGYTKGADQPEAAIAAIRGLTSVGPIIFLLISIGFAIGYPLDRERHNEIRRQLTARDRNPADHPSAGSATRQD